MSFINEIWLAIRTGMPDGGGTGSPSDPYAANTPESFGNILRLNAPSNRIIRMGPGIFQTRGGGGNGVADVDPGKFFRVRPGQKLIGAGIFATTLRFVWDDGNVAPTGTPGQRHNMLLGTDIAGSDFISSFELSDLTLDLGLDKTPFDPDPKTIEATQGLTATVSGDTVTISGVFTSSMEKRIIYIYDNSTNPPFELFARIQQILTSTTAKLRQDGVHRHRSSVLDLRREVFCNRRVCGRRQCPPKEGPDHKFWNSDAELIRRKDSGRAWPERRAQPNV